MYGFIYKTWFYLQNIVYGRWEKKTKRKQKRIKPKKKFSVWLPSHPHFYDMEADCFPVSEITENKPDLL